MEKVKEYITLIHDMENMASEVIFELINNPDVDWSGDKYRVSAKFEMPEEDKDLEYPWMNYNYFEIWTANGKESLSLGFGSYDEAKISIPAADQDSVWQSLKELGLPSYEL